MNTRSSLHSINYWRLCAPGFAKKFDRANTRPDIVSGDDEREQVGMSL